MDVIKKYGLSFTKTLVSEYPDEYYSVAVDFIENLFFNISKLSMKYDNKYFCELPYTYRYSERRLDSVILPVLSKLCNSMVLVEYPIERNSSTLKTEFGRLDYMCIYKGYSFVIELKHNFDSFYSDITREELISNWTVMNRQLMSIHKSIKKFEERTKSVIRIGIHIITSCSDKEPNNSIVSDYRQRIIDIQDRFLKDLKCCQSLKPDLILSWKIPMKLIEAYEITIPGLWSISKIYPPIIHKGSI